MYGLLSGEHFLWATCLSGSRMQQDTALEQRKSCLSIGAAFDPFHLVNEPLDHAVVPRLTTSIGDSLCVVGQSVYKVHEFRDATGLDGGFPLFQSL